MPLSLTPSNLFQFTTLLAPFLITGFIILESSFSYSLRGIIYLAGVLAASFIGILFRGVFKSPKPNFSIRSQACDIFDIPFSTDINKFSSPAFHTLYLSFTLVYVCANMWISGNWNIPTFIVLLVVCLMNGFYRLRLHCVKAVDIVLGAFFGVALGAGYYMLIKATHPDWVYFADSPSNREVCKIKDQKFKCTIRRSS